MAIRPDYTIGTVSLTANNATFTTSGSALQTAAVQAGDEIITRSGNVLVIASITGQNAGTLMQPCPAAAAGAGQPLRIRFQPDGSRYQGAVRDLVERLANGILESIANIPVQNGKTLVGNASGQYEPRDYIADPNGSVGKLAGLTLGARQILQTDQNGALKTVALAANKALVTNASGDVTPADITAAALVLLKLAGTAAANKLPYFNAATGAALADYTAAARALTNLSGTAAANMLPYLTGANGAGLTALTAFARTVFDDATGAEMFATMGTTQSFGTIGYTRLPNGLLVQWGTSTPTLTSGGYGSIAFPAAFPSTSWIATVMNGDAATQPQMLILKNRAALANNRLDVQAINAGSGAPIGSVAVRVDWMAIGG